MGLDVFVLPLHRYLQGQFETPVERFARESGASDKYHRTANKPSASESDARAFVQDLRRQLMQSLGPEIRWNDEGDVVLARQFNVHSWHALRAYAADQARPVPGFVFGPDSDKHPALGDIYNGARSGYSHLIRHNDCNGFYLPCNFDSPFALSIFDGEPVTPLIGSSLRLLKELNLLGQKLRISRDQGEEGWQEQIRHDDPLGSVKSAWTLLRHIARVSVSSKLPIVFDG